MSLAPMRLLIVDDDPQVREMFALVVALWGVTARTAAGATAALADLAAHPADVVLCDLRLQDLDGASLGAEIRARHPGTRLVFMTGLLDGPVADAAATMAPVALLEKPFEPERLRQALEAAQASLGR